MMIITNAVHDIDVGTPYTDIEVWENDVLSCMLQEVTMGCHKSITGRFDLMH